MKMPPKRGEIKYAHPQEARMMNEEEASTSKLKKYSVYDSKIREFEAEDVSVMHSVNRVKKFRSFGSIKDDDFDDRDTNVN